MKKLGRFLALTLVISIATGLLTGCTSNEKAVFDALLKANAVTSMETKTDLTLRVNVAGLSEEEMEDLQLQNTLRLLNSLKLNMVQKTVQNADKTLARSEADISADLGGMGLHTKLWVDMDLTGEKPVMKEIIEIPVIAAMAVPAQYRDKQYMIYDFSEDNTDSSLTSPDYNKVMNAAGEFQKNFTEFIKEYALEYNSGLELIKRNGTKAIGNETLPVYQLKLDDAAFKHVLRYSLIDFLSNEKGIQLFKDYVLDLMYAAENGEILTEDTEGEIETGFLEFEENLPELIGQLNTFFDSLDTVKIVGDKGIVINYVIKDGYIVNEYGSVDIIIDTQALASAFNNTLPLLDDMAAQDDLTAYEAATPVFELGFDYNTDTYNINKDISVRLPELTADNSFSYSDMLAAMEEERLMNSLPLLPEVTGNGANVVINGVLLEADAEARIINGRILVPARAVSEALGCEVEWDAQYGIATFTNDYFEVMVQNGSTAAFINGQPQTLDVPAEIFEDRIFVPLRFISEGLGGTVDWLDEQKTAVIYNFY